MTYNQFPQINDYNSQEENWEPEIGITPDRVKSIYEANGAKIKDKLDHFIDERIERQYGRSERDPDDEKQSRDEARRDLVKKTNWVYFPWDNTIVRYLSDEEHREATTWRNRNLITPEEQKRLSLARVAIFGLSVGSNVLDCISKAGIGNAYLLADPDQLSMSNLNRIYAYTADADLSKTTIAGRKLAQTNPYIKQQHLEKGYEGDATDQTVAEWGPTIIIEEVDNLRVKARLRRLAKNIRVPLITAADVGENSVIDVERYDTNEDYPPFNDKISEAQYQRLLEKDPSQEEAIMILKQLCGEENISPELSESVFNLGLGGTPQLGATALRGAAYTEFYARKILGQQDATISGTYVYKPLI